jgi:hypothetical protein
MNKLRRHPWVIMCLFSVAVGAGIALWTGLAGLWLPFGISVVGAGFGAIGVALWLWFPPKIS